MTALFGAAYDEKFSVRESTIYIIPIALDEFRAGHLSRAELRQLLGFGTRAKLDEFLTTHGIFGTYTEADLARDREDLRRLGL